MAAGLPEPDGSCWRPWRSSHQASILTFGRGWQIFFLSHLKMLQTTVALFAGELEADEPYLLLCRYRCGETISHPRWPELVPGPLANTKSASWALHPQRALRGFWCHSGHENQGKIKFAPFYSALGTSSEYPHIFSVVTEYFPDGTKKWAPFSNYAPPRTRCWTSRTFPITSGRRWDNASSHFIFFFQWGGSFFICFH